jgi:hypothetical protein
LSRDVPVLGSSVRVALGVLLGLVVAVPAYRGLEWFLLRHSDWYHHVWSEFATLSPGTFVGFATVPACAALFGGIVAQGVGRRSAVATGFLFAAALACILWPPHLRPTWRHVAFGIGVLAPSLLACLIIQRVGETRVARA